MKKTLIIAAAIMVFTACEKNKDTTTVETESTVIEAEQDTVITDTNTVTASENEILESPAAAHEESIKAVKPAKAITVEYASFGDKILADKALSKDQMLKKYKNLKSGDTVAVKFKSRIKEVCSKKGCWMSLELPGGAESFVKFKDYAFFVPLNAAEQEAIVSGKAFVSETSVSQLRHYAKDGGQSDQEVAKITEPKIEYKFMADGVLISK